MLAGMRGATPLTTSLADRFGVSVPTMAFGALGVTAAALGGWWALRTPPAPAPEAVLPTVAEVFIPEIPTTPTTPQGLPYGLVVHVAGAVLQPGVHELTEGSRVLDAITAAGGLTPTADQARLNLAQPIADGSRIWIPEIGELVEPSVVGVTPPAGGNTAPINLNTVDGKTLEELPGIGPSLAFAIIQFRDEHGGFSSVDQLDQVSGIGPALVERLRSLVRI